MKKLLALPLLALCLNGCFGAILFAGVAAGMVTTMIVYDKRPMKTILEDHAIAREAQSYINTNQELKGKVHITVVAFNRIVLMVGEAQTEALRQKAHDIVARTSDIKRIYNEVTIAGPSGYLDRTNDSWVGSKVKTALLTTKGLRSSQIQTIVDSGVVYLMGLVTHRQAELAANAVRRVSGVRKVVKVFEYQR